MPATSSATYAFSMQVDDYVLEAFERIGKTDDAVKVPQIRSARRSLNLMQAEWGNRGVNLWTVERVSVALTAGIGTVTTGVGTIDVLDTTMTVDGLERPLAALSRTDYASIPDKATEGDPNQFWVERVLPTPIIHLWPIQTVGTRTLNYYRMKQMQDMTALYQLPNAPYLWFDAIAAGLTARLAEKYAPAMWKDKVLVADNALRLAMGENRERIPTSYQFDMAGWGQR
jgi:hypothetical protein